MDAKEFRIGNCMYNHSGTLQYISHRKISDISSNPDNNGFTQVPLTAEILRRFKFIHNSETPVSSKGLVYYKWPYYWCNGSFFIHIESLDPNTTDVEVKHINYLHELQNVYYWLQREELEMNNVHS